jgi:hypothetical protein
MKYIKLFEENKIEIDDFDKIKNWYYTTDQNLTPILMTLIDINISPLNVKNPNKVYHYRIIYSDGDTYETYYDTKDLKNLIDQILQKTKIRPATPEEIEEFEMKSNAKKYNL